MLDGAVTSVHMLLSADRLPPCFACRWHPRRRGGGGAQAAGRAGSKQLSLQEVQQILGLESGATWEQITKKYDHLFMANEKNGTFYLQSKVFRARERLEQEFMHLLAFHPNGIVVRHRCAPSL